MIELRQITFSYKGSPMGGKAFWRVQDRKREAYRMSTSPYKTGSVFCFADAAAVVKQQSPGL